MIRVGDIFNTNEGYGVEVVEYDNYHKITIEFTDKFRYRRVVRGGDLKKGEIKNPYHKSIFGVGYLGVGPYNVSENGKKSRAYSIWSGVLKRCYSGKYTNRSRSYEDCTVAEEWHCFQDFAHWYYKQPNAENPEFQLDKDLILMGNRIYSSSTSSFVPASVNTLLLDCGSARGSYPLGVRKVGNKYETRLRVGNHRVKLGAFRTPEEAFRVYKKAKEAHVKKVAEENKDKVDKRVYDYLMNWEVPLEK